MPTASPSKPRSMSAHHVRWYTPLRSSSTAVAIHASMRVVERPASSAFKLASGRVPARTSQMAVSLEHVILSALLKKEIGCHPMITALLLALQLGTPPVYDRVI